MTGSHTAIVEDVPGVTRDRNYLDAEWEGKNFFVVDTGGFYAGPSDDIVKQVTEQACLRLKKGMSSSPDARRQGGAHPF